MKLINLTPHDVHIADADGNIIRVIPPEPVPARVYSTFIERGAIDGVPLVDTVFGEVQNLPAPVDGFFYIVSQIVIAATNGRPDLVRPDTGPNAIREDGRIVAVRALTR